MRNRKFDSTKPIKFIDNKKVFDELDAAEDTLIVVPSEQDRPHPQPKKQDIMIPMIDTVKRITQIKKFAKITPNYIRLPAYLNLPNANVYELTEVDHIFLKGHEERFIHRGKKVLTQDFLRKAITQLEIKAGKDMILPRSKGWIMAFFQKQYKDLLQMENIQIFGETIYNYWKNRRQELRFPLLRVLWKPSPDQYNHMLAFRPRQRQKRSLRRTNRIQQDDILQQLYQEFDDAALMVDRIQARQNLKFKQIQLQKISFLNQCRGYISNNQIFEQYRPEDRSIDKQKMKKFHIQLEDYRNRKQTQEIVSIPTQSILNNIDQKLTITNFLASVIYEAEQLGISHQKIFINTNNNLPILQKTKSFQQTIYTPIQSIPQKIEEEEKNPQDVINISLQRHNQLVIRTLQKSNDPINHIKPCLNYLEYKRRQVDGYFFGADDEVDSKDLRKNITSSFRKFLQMQQLTRTFSATSENN